MRWLLLVVLALAGCSSSGFGDCAPRKCPRLRITSKILAANITVGIGEPKTSGTCSVTIDSLETGGPQVDVRFVCDTPKGRFKLNESLPDLRTLSTRTIDGYEITSLERPGTARCEGTFTPAPFDVTVESQAGETTSAPPYVTPDYHRVFRLLIAESSLRLATPYDVCTIPADVRFLADVRFEQTAADYSMDSDALCGCPM